MSNTNLKTPSKVRTPSAKLADKQKSKSSKSSLKDSAKSKRDRRKSLTGDDDRDARDGESTSLAWFVLNEDQLDELEGEDNSASLQKLCSFLNLPQYKTDVMQNIAASYHFGNYLFARNHGFSHIQISTFMGIMKLILNRSIEESLTLMKSVQYFKTILLNHAGGKTFSNDDEWAIFTPKETKLISDFAMSTFYQHYRLFCYVYNNDQEKEEPKDLVALPSSTTPDSQSIKPQESSVPTTISKSESQNQNNAPENSIVNVGVMATGDNTIIPLPSTTDAAPVNPSLPDSESISTIQTLLDTLESKMTLEVECKLDVLKGRVESLEKLLGRKEKKK